MKQTKASTIAALSFMLLMMIPFANRANAETGNTEGQLRVGYIFTDEEGSLAVNRETFNLYEGVGVSLLGFQRTLTNGSILRANLRNASLNNRNLNLSWSRSRLFKASFRHNKYRRFYDFDGTQLTKRWLTGGQVSFRPQEHFELFGGVEGVKREGSSLILDQIANDTIVTAVDYTKTEFNGGLRVFDRHGRAEVEYRGASFENNLDADRDRDMKTLRLSAVTNVPRVDWLTLAGGYDFREDELNASQLKLKTNIGWGSAIAKWRNGYRLQYRFSFARTERDVDSIETDNVANTIIASRSWQGKGGVKLGYENRVSDDLTDRTVSDGFLFGGWYKPTARWVARVDVSTRNKDVKSGATLTGNEEFTRHKIELTHRSPIWGDVTASWTGRVREHDPDLSIRDTLTIDDQVTRLEFNALTLNANLISKRLGRATVTYTYYLGEFQYNSVATNYEFSDHLVRAMLYPLAKRSFELYGGGTYYRSRRDIDVEKFSVIFGAEYTVDKDYKAGVRYDVFNFDDFLLTNNFYTGNIVEIYLTRAIGN